MLTTFLEPFPERAWYPEERMDAKEGECTKQQAGHTPECIKEIWILIPVMVGGMGEISSKFPVGSRMAFSAGFNYISSVQTGFTVIGRQDIMGPMAVGAFGCLLPT